MLLFELKKQTQSLHMQLHKVVDLSAMQQDLTAYVRGLLGFFQAIAPLEYQLDRYARQNSTNRPPLDCKTAWLLQDLSCFGIAPTDLCVHFSEDENRWLNQLIDPAEMQPTPEENFSAIASQAQPLPEPLTVQEIASLDAEIGVRYVLEGMSLGSTRIFPLLQSAHQRSADQGLRFFRAYGGPDATKDHWDSFRQWVASQELDAEITIGGAKSTFARFATILQHWFLMQEQLSK